MTREDIIKLAREAGLQVADNYDYRGSFEKLTFPEREEFLKMLHFATLVAAAEREACREIAFRMARTDEDAVDVSHAIRARSE